MGMPVTLQVVDESATDAALERVFAYFAYIDAKFSTFKPTSEISALNRNELTLAEASEDMQTVFALAEQTRQETNGYFDILRNGMYDPSGLVKGWAIRNAARLFCDMGFQNFYVDAGGDVQAAGKNSRGQSWRVGIRNPFHRQEIVKVLYLRDCGIATSGTYARGQHIYNPRVERDPLDEIVSLTVIGPDVYEADRFATAAFAMGRRGIYFIERLDGFEGYMIDCNKQATLTTGFSSYVTPD